MADQEQARRVVLARFRDRMNRLAALLPMPKTSAEATASETEQATRLPDRMHDHRARAVQGRERQRRTG
jgi:hypothetical protein